MRRGFWLFASFVVAASLGVGSARADGTTTTTTTTPGTTTTTMTAAPSYAPLATAYLPARCVGAGDAAIVVPGGQVLGLGMPAAGGSDRFIELITLPVGGNWSRGPIT